MRILIINRYMGLYGGAETVIKELGWHLNRLGAESRILTLNISPEVRKLCAGLDIVVPEEEFLYKFRSGGFWLSLGIIREIRALRKLVKEHAGGFDLINAHNFPASWVCGGLDKPVVWMCNEVPDFYNNPAPSSALRLLRWFGLGRDRRIIRRDIGAICVADEYNAAKVIQRYGRKPRIINYGIDYDFFSRPEGAEEAREKYSLTGSFVLLQAGMLSPEKNQLKSVQAVEALRDDIPNIRLVLAGRPQSPYDGMLRQYIKEKGLDKYIVFTGHITKAQVRGLYQACNIALFPVKSQGGWLAPFEALCAGRPVVVSSTMGAASVISRQGLGLVRDDLAEAVKSIHGSYEDFSLQAQKAGEWVKNNLTWGLFSRRMLDVFEETLEKGAGRL